MYVRLVQDMYEGAKTQVRSSVELTEWIPVRAGLHQGSATGDGNLDVEITHRVQAGWKNLRQMPGVLCNRRLNIEVKGRAHKTVVRRALIYGAETRPVKRVQEKKLDAVEMKMLRWMCGVTKMDRIKKERIRGTTKVVDYQRMSRKEDCSGMAM
ncbi:uncharacterized protein [Macrobrachium rosenbergii]|uniref:uncharacterized protein n=1 Tax=Macrobrachium rosenbergii TaxID=79674 RepID=UPI0034D6944D